jgi:acetolactate synthase small subunit
MVAFSFGGKAMRWCFWTKMEELGRMESRVLQVLDRLQAEVVTLSSTRLDGRIFVSCLLEAEERQAARIEALLRKIHGMLTVKVVPAVAATRRMIALFRILCDITGRAEVLQFVGALKARAVTIRPLWVAFEMVGTPEEIEGVYQSALGYGIVDVVSAGCALMTSTNDAEGEARARSEEEEFLGGAHSTPVQEDLHEPLGSRDERNLLKTNTGARIAMYQGARKI